MCDCYFHPCKGCKVQIPIHLADFTTPRRDIDVYCDKCWTQATAARKKRMSYVVWEIQTHSARSIRNEKVSWMRKELRQENKLWGNRSIVIVAKSRIARRCCPGNHPNTLAQHDATEVHIMGRRRQK